MEKSLDQYIAELEALRAVHGGKIRVIKEHAVPAPSPEYMSAVPEHEVHEYINI